MNRRKTVGKLFLFLLIVLSLGGCGYRYFLGLHGPSIRNSPDSHDLAETSDAVCLGCHGSADNADEAPLTSHGYFTGCVKCHNDPPS